MIKLESCPLEFLRYGSRYKAVGSDLVMYMNIVVYMSVVIIIRDGSWTVVEQTAGL